MGSAAAKQSQRKLKMCEPSCGSGEYSLLLNQSRSTDSNGSDGENMVEPVHSSDGFYSGGEDHLSNQLSDQIQIRTSSRRTEVIDEWELIEEQQDLNSIDKWELFDTNESILSYPEPKISSPSEIAADYIPPEVSNETTVGNSVSSEHCETFEFFGIVRARINSFERKINVRRMTRAILSSNYQLAKKKKVVFYFTSLTCVTSTWEDCEEARRILQGYEVCLDEKDVSADARFKEELNELLGMNFGGKLPRIFVNGYYIGGSEEVKKLHLSGKLGYVLHECDTRGAVEIYGNLLCPGCHDQRILPCLNCFGNGSNRRLFLECIDECEDKDHSELCQDCNKDGLVSCPVCR